MFSQAVRKHYSIENQLRRVVDVSFKSPHHQNKS